MLIEIEAGWNAIAIEADRCKRWSEQLLDEAIKASPFRKAKVPVSIQPASSNRKLAPQRQVDVDGRQRNVPIGPFVSSTYVSIEATCPTDCPYRGNGCYAQAGMTVSSLDRVAVRKQWTGIATIDAEVAAIDGLFVRGVPQDGARGGRDLRLHVSGDAATPAGARRLAAAAERWQARGGGAVWTFTHLWKKIPRIDWGPIAIMASVETMRDAGVALSRGYAPALTVEEHADDVAIPITGGKLVPCPSQTRGRTCAECRICLDPKLAARKVGITLSLHGQEADRAARRLRVLQGR